MEGTRRGIGRDYADSDAGACRGDCRLRRDGAAVVYLTGSELALFTNGYLPGRDQAFRNAERERAELKDLRVKARPASHEVVEPKRAA